MRWNSRALRRRFESKRGAVHSLEAFLSAIIIFSTLLYASYIPRDKDEDCDRSLGAIGIQVLARLDSGKTLGSIVERHDWNLLEQCIRVIIPAGFSFNMTIFDESGDQINDRPISNGGLVGQNIDSVEYLLVVESEDCPIYRIRLQLGR